MATGRGEPRGAGGAGSCSEGSPSPAWMLRGQHPGSAVAARLGSQEHWSCLRLRRPQGVDSPFDVRVQIPFRG